MIPYKSSTCVWAYFLIKLNIAQYLRSFFTKHPGWLRLLQMLQNTWEYWRNIDNTEKKEKRRSRKRSPISMSRSSKQSLNAMLKCKKTENILIAETSREDKVYYLFSVLFFSLNVCQLLWKAKENYEKEVCRGDIVFQSTKMKCGIENYSVLIPLFLNAKVLLPLEYCIISRYFFLSKALFFDSKQFILPSSSHLLHLIKANFCMKILKKVTKTLMRNIQKKTRNLTKT